MIPSVEEVRQYCQERGNNIDPEYFVAFYEANGWVQGKKPIKSWKACVITWEKREPSRQPSAPAVPKIDEVPHHIREAQEIARQRAVRGAK